MRIVVADYSGHPFQVQLSRELARRGHKVLHLHFADFQTPKGRLILGPEDPITLSIEPIFLGKNFAKHSFFKRRLQEVAVGKLFARRISSFRADVVLGSNLPLDSLRIVAKNCRSENRAFIFWQQDIYSIAIDRILRHKLGPIGALIGKYYKRIERAVLRESQAVVAISEDFLPYLSKEFGFTGDQLHVVENWAPLEEIFPGPKENEWARANDLIGKDVVLYSGTIGRKHDPSQILAVAMALRERPNTEVVVTSEGPGAEWLRQKAQELKLPSLQVKNFQPSEAYSDVLASANVLFCILESDSGIFSVPSKVLSYLCAGRPIVVSAPAENLASRLVLRSGAGLIVPAGDNIGLAKAIRTFLDSPLKSKNAGEYGRAHAEREFKIKDIGDNFENIMASAYDSIKGPSRWIRSSGILRGEGTT